MDRIVIIEPYNPEWPGLFREIGARLRRADKWAQDTGWAPGPSDG